MTTTGIKAGNIPNQESVTLASSVSYKNKKSDNGLYSLPSNVHPTSGDITHNNYYDVNGDGIMEVIGTSRVNYETFLHLVSTPTGNVLDSIRNKDFKEFKKFIKLDNTEAVYAYTGNVTYGAEHYIAPWNNLAQTTVISVGDCVFGDVNGDGLIDYISWDDYESFNSKKNVIKAYIRKADGTYEQQQLAITDDANELTTIALGNYTPGSRLPSLSDGMFVKTGEREYIDETEETDAEMSSMMKSVASDSDGYDSADKIYFKDMNGDGLQDIVTQKYVFYNLGNNRFFRSAHVGKIFSADVNGDGINDYVDFGAGKVTLYLTKADGSLGDGKELFENSAMQNAFFGDFDRDGDVDLLFFIPNKDITYIVFYRNDGNGEFKRKETYIDGKYTSYTCKDYDGDGLYEIIASLADDNYGTYDYLLKCDLKKVEVTVTALDYANIVVGDFNNDGFTEYGYSTGYPLYTFVYGPIPNAKKNTAPSKMQKPQAQFFADANKLRITWQRGSDAQTSACDLTYELRIGTQPGKGDILYANSLADGRRRNLFGGNMGMALSYMFDAERLDAGKYYISVQAIDAGGLGGAWSDECVYEHKQTAPSIAQLPVNITAADTLQLRVNNPRSDAKYTWNVENGTIISQSNNGSTAQAILHAAGNLKVSVAMELGGQTYKSKEKTLSVLPFTKIFDYYTLEFYNVFDANQDGKPEIYNRNNPIFNFNAKGEKTEIKKSFNSDLSDRMTPFDYNYDGYPDFLLDRSSKNVYLNSCEQDNDFEYITDAGIYSSPSYPATKPILDYNNDGKFDFVGYLNTTKASDTSLKTTEQKFGYYNNKCIICDFNRDGYWDVASDEFREINVYIKTVSANVANDYEQKLAVKINYNGDYHLEGVADFNNDGYPDFLLKNNNNERVVIKGKPVDQWPCDEVVMTIHSSYPLTVSNDLDNNGFVDLVTAIPKFSPVGGDQTQYCVYLIQPDFKYAKVNYPRHDTDFISNELLWQPLFPGDYAIGLKSNIKNEAPSVPENLRVGITDKGMLLKWDDAKDDRTPATQMRYNVSVKYKNKKVGEKNAFLISPLNGLANEATICSNVLYRKATQMYIPLDVLKSGESYEVQVQAIDLMGAHSPMTKPVEIKVNTNGYLSAAHQMVAKGETCNVQFVGTQPSNYTIKAGTDATVNDKNNGKLSISWSTSGEKNIDMIADGCTFSTIVKVYAPEDFALAIPSKVMKDTPISVKRPKTEFDNDISYFNVKGVTKSQTTNDGFILTLGDAGYNEVISSVGFNDGSECTFVNKTTVTEETMPDANITGVLADGNHYRVNWNTSVPQMVDRVEILRETNRYNEFEVVATMPVSQGSWLDTTSDNRIQTQRYRIRLLANNNIQTSTFSETHKPLHVTIYKSATKGYSLVWNAYEGMDIESYRILRGTSTDNLTQIAEVAGSLQNYTDISAPAGTCFYAIAYVPASTQQFAESCAMRSNTSNAYMLSNAVSTAEAIEAVAATSIEIGILEKYDSNTLYGGDCRFHLTATMLPTNASLSDVRWSIVSGDDIAHLSSDGVLTSKGLDWGDVVVRAEATDGSGLYSEKKIFIKGTYHYEDIDLYMPKTTIEVGEKMQLTRVAYPSYLKASSILVNATNNCIYIDHDNYVVTGVEPGSGIIALTTRDGSNISKQITLKVVQPSGIEQISTATSNTTKYYNLEGVRVQSLQKGHIYITDKGKKIFIK
ncbi:FG-GAP-like repeat-containing protein [Prevotella sp.]|uniref:FG-GAP-like repeat-containing protein n=1 Tax=Prevotella sp. TaxID=59823 RepID=UPI0027E27982|nr:FG-GAP-like repeat-containing protein [Prevotella sp.]